MEFSSEDRRFMAQAIELARQGMSLASPNPHVGAVVLDAQGKICGAGFHTYAGLKHGEAFALERAGTLAHGGTLYVNLEPCCHQGRTGPCTDAIIAAGVKRVVAATVDPNPLVAGKGIEQLRVAGIVVETGLMQTEAQKLNEAFAKYIRCRQPLITLKSAMTLDGKIAAPENDNRKRSVSSPASASSSWITGDEARAHVQMLRHESDAIMVGVGTVLADDPLLTDRTGRPRRRPLLRVILDSRLHLPIESRLVKTVQGGNDVLVFCSFAEEKKRRALEERGVRVEQVPLGAGNGRPDLVAVANRLGALEITSLLIEGGAMVNWTALASGIADKVFLYYAPRILGGADSVPFAGGQGFRRMPDAPQIGNISIHRFGDDFAVEGYLRDPWEAPADSIAREKN